MKRAILLITCLVSLGPLSIAQTATVTDPNAPQIEFESKTIDYGTITRGSDPFRVFQFKNTGKAPLIIQNAVGSCGCTIPSWPKEPIAPGASGEIKVRYDTKRLGPINRSVTVMTNTEPAATTLRIKGTVKAGQQKSVSSPKSETNNGQSAVH